MFPFKTLMPLALLVSFFLMLSGCGYAGEKAMDKNPTPGSGEVPEWLQLSHRKSGFLNFDFEPMDPADIEALTAGFDDETDQQEPSSGAGVSAPKPNPTGSPFEPGTLDDMIWQHRQKALSGTGAISPNPAMPGSPYEAGTLDDMIWQQKQRSFP
jgi:hypothetical protein